MSTDMRKIRGLGASGVGTGHYIRQRVSAIALVFLVPWFMVSVLGACQTGYEGALAWVRKPVNAVLLILMLSAALYHMRLGLQTVIEDYIAKTGTRQSLLILNTFVVIALFVAAIVSVLKIWIVVGT